MTTLEDATPTLPDVAALAAEVMAVVGKATPGEWQVWTDACHFDTASDIRVDGRMVAQTVSDYPALVNDAAAIVAAVNFVRDGLPALMAREAALRDAAYDAATSLNAAISLLENGGRKAAASDKIFEQMLRDYRASVDRARAALAGGK